MRLLTATSRTQGQRASDFNWCIEGELVTPSKLICARDEREGPDGGCGCGRSFGGLHSGKSVTTALVSDIDGFTREDLALAVRASREDGGWLALTDDPDGWVAEEVAEIMLAAELYPVGTVIEIRMAEITAREVRVP
jgi:hypothetical protein